MTKLVIPECFIQYMPVLNVLFNICTKSVRAGLHLALLNDN